MKTGFRITTSIAILIAFEITSSVQADEPKVEAKPAVEAKKEPDGDKEKAATKQAKKAAAELEALATPFAEALSGKLELKADKPVDDPRLAQWIPQFTQQYRSILTSELNFIRQVCDLTPEQRPKIKAAGVAAVTEAARKMAEYQVRAQRGQGAVRRIEPRQIIHDALAKVLQETLTAEQMADYTQESLERKQLRKRAAILYVVARLDTAMCLTTTQRDKIVESISAGWQDKWESWLSMSAYGDQYFPVVPNDRVVLHLNAEQKSVWNGLQKMEFGDVHFHDQQQENDGWWGAEPAEANAAGNAVRVFVEE